MTDDMMNLRDLARESDQERDEPESCSSAQNALGWAVGGVLQRLPRPASQDGVPGLLGTSSAQADDTGSELSHGTGCHARRRVVASLRKVFIRVRAAATEAETLPDTLDIPPTRLRQPTGTSTMRSLRAAARICISRFQP